MSALYSIGLDYGTNTVRCLVVDVSNGREVGTAVWEYAHGTHGVMLARDPNLARQHPGDYLEGAAVTIQQALKQAKIKPAQVVGIGVDTTGSTPLPVDADGKPLAFDKRFAKNLNAMAWLWKDHTAHKEAAEIT
jgi:L-ribulokinase